MNSRAVFLIPFFLIFLLSSCGTFKSLDITKRHYRPGYSVSVNSLKAVPVKNTINYERSQITLNKQDVADETLKKAPLSKTRKKSKPLFNDNFKSVKTTVLDKAKNSTNNAKHVSFAPVHKVNTVTTSEKLISENRSKNISTEGKSYSLSTVLFVVGSILIIWGLLTLFGSIAGMSAGLALALTLILGLVLVIAWGIVILMIKSWFNGTN